MYSPNVVPPDIYRTVNQFLEIWFQHLDAWSHFYARLESFEQRMIFVEATKEMMHSFISTLESLDIIETEALNNLPPIQEEKQEDI